MHKAPEILDSERQRPAARSGYSMDDLSLLEPKDLDLSDRVVKWLADHPDAASHLRLSRAPSGAEGDLTYEEFRQGVIKTEILAGIVLVTKYQGFCRNAPVFTMLDTFARYSPLFEASGLIGRLRSFEIRLFILKEQLHSLLAAKFRKATETVSDLVHLLASRDVVPKDIIMHVDLRELTLDEGELVADDAWCTCLSRAIVSAESKVASMCESIKSVVGKRREVKSEVARLLEQQRESYDEERQRVVFTVDEQVFDLLVNPDSSAHELYRVFDEKRTPAAFAELRDGMIQMCGIEEAGDRTLLAYVLLKSVGQVCAPDVVVDGPGTSDDSATCFGIELLCQLDPISVFWAIADHADGSDAETCVQNAADALKAITSSHMKVLEFVYEMVADVCISETDKAVHTALGRLLHGA